MGKRLTIVCVLCCLLLSLQAQVVWHNPQQGDTARIQGRGWNTEMKGNYHRFPDRMKPTMREAVWNLSTNSAGLHIDFYTNATDITVRYTVSGRKALPNMTAIGTSGIDLYATDSNGVTDWCACPGQYTFGNAISDTITFYYRRLAYHNSHKMGSEYHLFLPLYNTVTWMEIGTNEGASFKWSPLSTEKPIVAYGTSILQGASASRPAMAWTNILQRQLDAPVFNYGFSGNGWMEEEVFNALSELDARLYILDCMPNMHQWKDEIVSRTIAGVKKLRAKHNAPILLVENDGYMHGKTNPHATNDGNALNQELRKAYEALLAQGMKDIYYLTLEEIGITPDAQIDGSHPTDVGMELYAKAYMEKITDILDLHPLSEYMPVRQRREPNVYEWNERHESVLQRNRTIQPDVMMIGNSITHYWAGEPSHRIHRGTEAWNRLFEGLKVTNMGFGWDRIENVLWRIQHGELDNIQPRHICLMIGTNNISIRESNEKIAQGIVELVDVIRRKQPQAHIHVLKVFPRKDMNNAVREVNRLLEQKLKTDALTELVDLTPVLTLSNGQIDPTLYGSDGLHPATKGYEKVAETLKNIIK